MLILGLLAGASLAAPDGTTAALLATPRPTATFKACHLCEEEIGVTPRTPTSPSPPSVAEPDAAGRVRGILFWMQGCAHCHEVLEQVLPALQEKYGEQLEIRLVELTGIQDVDRLYGMAASFGIPKEQVGVPLVVIGDRALAGKEAIATELPGLIETYLTAGGVDWPEAPEVTALLAGQEAAEDICQFAEPCAGEATPGPAATLMGSSPGINGKTQDSGGSTEGEPASIGLLIGLSAGAIVGLGWVGVRLRRARRRQD